MYPNHGPLTTVQATHGEGCFGVADVEKSTNCIRISKLVYGCEGAVWADRVRIESAYSCVLVSFKSRGAANTNVAGRFGWQAVSFVV
jgi:hypothetical protein